jgi:signal transduction histidine kinase
MIDLDDDEEDEYPLSFYSKDIMFEDGEATVYMLGYFDNQFYVAASYLELLISILVFLGIYAAVVESKINYVMLLEREIEILETGGLEHAITVKGNDELSALAEELNQMRLTLYDTMQREKDAVQMNYNLVVSVAHDLRTPLTALMLYLNLLYNKKYKDEKQMEKYIEKSMLKAEQIRNMSDQLFERFLLSREEEPVSEAPQKAQYIFEDILSDMMVYLESDQYKVESRIEWPDVRLCVVPDYIERIMNNLSSNLIKYADKTVPVVIYLHIEKKQLILGVRNKIQIGADKQESTKVGIQNMQIMMQKMDGSISIEHTPEFFEIRLNFVIAV